MRHFVLYRAAPFLPKKRRGKSMLNMLFDRGCALILSCFFKSRTKCSRQGTSERLGRRKAAKRPVRYRLCGELIRGLRNLETPCKGVAPTGANFLLVRKFPKGKRIVTFCGVQKVTQKARARTCKKLPVASFCASETAETGRIANGCEQGDHVSRSRLRPATSVQNSTEYFFRDISVFRP